MSPRIEYFQRINAQPSPLLEVGNELAPLISIRGKYLPVEIDLCMQISERLMTSDNPVAQSRGMFIRMQCDGEDAGEFFEAHRESWGIPKFSQDLVTVEDFQLGFLYTFRDHSTFWMENDAARDWFYTSSEARTVGEYEFWAEEPFLDDDLRIIGDYKSILWTLVTFHKDYYALVSPAFTPQDLEDYLEQFNEFEEGLELEELAQIIQGNPNWAIHY